MATVFQDPNIFSDPHILFFFSRFQNFTWPPLMFVGTFGVFKVLFSSKADLALWISRSYFFKSIPRISQFSYG